MPAKHYQIVSLYKKKKKQKTVISERRHENEKEMNALVSWNMLQLQIAGILSPSLMKTRLRYSVSEAKLETI